MKDMVVLRKEAEFLNSQLITIWTKYDFTNRSENYERRVPNIEFKVPVKWVLNEVERYPKGYVRECQIEYNGNTYIFEIITWLADEHTVQKYHLEIYVPAGDGVGGKNLILSERLCKRSGSK